MANVKEKKRFTKRSFFAVFVAVCVLASTAFSIATPYVNNQGPAVPSSSNIAQNVATQNGVLAKPVTLAKGVGKAHITGANLTKPDNSNDQSTQKN